MKGQALPASLLRDPVHLLALGFGSGLAPKAPGTWGSLVGLLIYLALPGMTPWVYVSFLVSATALGIWLCGESAKRLGVHDHGGIVWDEMVGIWLTLFLAPPGWWVLLAGFVLFRIFDIAKPWPIRWLDRRVHGGLGIMLDDLVAAGFAWAGVQGLTWLWH